MDPIAMILIAIFVIYALKGLTTFFLTGLITSMIGMSRYHMKKFKAKSKIADTAMLMFGLAFLVSAAKVVIPVLCIIGVGAGVHAYYLVSLIAFVLFAAIRGIGINFGVACKGCGTIRIDPLELLAIFFSAMAYFA